MGSGRVSGGRGDTPAPLKGTALLPKTFSLVDRSAKLGIIKKNTAARYKSRLHLRLKALEPKAA